ncbi:MAG: hypothetical protein MI922_30715, partial [Bacteroidales bacterium]|nr:hypothetical protein [Bacteroidales bacterium]
MVKKKIIYILSMLYLANLGIVAQYYEQQKEKFDTIIKVENTKLPVDVTNVTQNYVSYKVTGSSETYRMNLKDVHKIIYKNGRIEPFNPIAFEVISDSSYKAVTFTRRKRDVEGMHKRGNILAHGESKRGLEASKTNAKIKAQKQAAQLKGQVVLITKQMPTGEYGDPSPGFKIHGTVYGFEPLEDDE